MIDLKLIIMKRPNEDDLRDLWLKKYHNITSAKLVELLPKEVLKNSNWFKLYPCTQQQHDEWVIECKTLLKKKYKITIYILERSWGLLYLQCSPYVLTEGELDNA